MRNIKELIDRKIYATVAQMNLITSVISNGDRAELDDNGGSVGIESAGFA